MFLGKCWLQTYLTQQNHFQDSEESFDPPAGVLLSMSLHEIYENAFAAMNAKQGHMTAVIKRQKEAGK